MHHMNSIIEQCISFISTWTLLMLLHAQAQWPQVINKSFWPFAMWHAVNIYINCYQGCNGIAVPRIYQYFNLTAT